MIVIDLCHTFDATQSCIPGPFLFIPNNHCINYSMRPVVLEFLNVARWLHSEIISILLATHTFSGSLLVADTMHN